MGWKRRNKTAIICSMLLYAESSKEATDKNLELLREISKFNVHQYQKISYISVCHQQAMTLTLPYSDLSGIHI